MELLCLEKDLVVDETVTVQELGNRSYEILLLVLGRLRSWNQVGARLLSKYTSEGSSVHEIVDVRDHSGDVRELLTRDSLKDRVDLVTGTHWNP